MKPFYLSHTRNRLKAGFNLVEAVLSLGVLSLGFLALIPLLALGSQTARTAHDSRATTQIAETLIEEAKQGTLSSGPLYLDVRGNPCISTQAIYTAQTTFRPLPGQTATDGASPQQLVVRITPKGSPDRARIYAIVLPTP